SWRESLARTPSAKSRTRSPGLPSLDQSAKRSASEISVRRRHWPYDRFAASRCGRSPALVTAASSDTTNHGRARAVEGGRSDAGSRVRRVGGQEGGRSLAVRPGGV